jgi:hypothetical protein
VRQSLPQAGPGDEDRRGAVATTESDLTARRGCARMISAAGNCGDVHTVRTERSDGVRTS